MVMVSAIEFQQVQFSYRNRMIFPKLDLKIEAGDFVGILGPNGCGKTTLLKLTAGVERSDIGEVRVMGKVVQEYPRKTLAQSLAVLPQEAYVDYPFSAWEIALMGRAPFLSLFQTPSADDLAFVREAMQQTDCLQFSDRDVRTLSGGERERVMLARALAQNPRILLLDEPTTFLDLRHKTVIYSLLTRLNREKNLTILAVLHDLNLAAAMCKTILLIKDGMIHCMGHPKEVLTEQNIREVFGVTVHQELSNRTGRPYFLYN
ncbi:MAG: ABC transporter ATP-binding protein [Deltaproteobacteria bacterium]|nr:ABC transporter ATP-binding protein [Deltaproteobacteria bacterium]